MPPEPYLVFSAPLGGRYIDTQQRCLVHRVFETSGEEDALLHVSGDSTTIHRLGPCQTVMFIDDLPEQETCDTACAESHDTTSKEVRQVHAVGAEKLFLAIKANAE